MMNASFYKKSLFNIVKAQVVLLVIVVMAALLLMLYQRNDIFVSILLGSGLASLTQLLLAIPLMKSWLYARADIEIEPKTLMLWFRRSQGLKWIFSILVFIFVFKLSDQLPIFPLWFFGSFFFSLFFGYLFFAWFESVTMRPAK